MTDTTKPNGDRLREGTASSGSTSPPLDMALLRDLAKEFGYWPASTHEADIERHRRDNAADKARHEAYLREYGPGGPKRHRWDHLRKEGQ